jgi:hypothetical protein
LVIPEELVHRIIGDHHKSRYAAHPGDKRTQQWMGRLYYWPSMHRGTEDYVLNCDTCARWKTGRTQFAPMGSLAEANEPGEIASIDITGPHTMTPRGNKYLLMYMETFTKWAEEVPLPDQGATTVAHAQVTQIFTRHAVCPTPE